MVTLPRSIAAGMPAFCSSPTIGPGLNGVSPARTHKSSGATSPPLAGARVFVPSSSLNKRNGLMSAVTTAVWPSIVSPSFTRSDFFALACSSASRSRLFLATVIVASPELLADGLELGGGDPVDVHDPDDLRLGAAGRQVLDELFLVGSDMRHRRHLRGTSPPGPSWSSGTPTGC